MLETYTNTKTEIVINMNYLYLHYRLDQINEWVVRSLTRSEDSLIIPYDNILCDVILKTFINMKTLIIYTTSKTGRHSYHFKWEIFLEIVNLSQSWKEIILIGIRFNEDCQSWLFYLWESSSLKMKNRFNEKGQINIVLKQEKSQLFGGAIQDLLVITR